MSPWPVVAVLMNVLVANFGIWLLAKEVDRLDDAIKHINGHVCDCTDDEPDEEAIDERDDPNAPDGFDDDMV